MTTVEELGEYIFNPIQDGFFWGLLTDGGEVKRTPLLKICHTYPPMMKLT